MWHTWNTAGLNENWWWWLIVFDCPQLLSTPAENDYSYLCIIINLYLYLFWQNMHLYMCTRGLDGLQLEPCVLNSEIRFKYYLFHCISDWYIWKVKRQYELPFKRHTESTYLSSSTNFPYYILLPLMFWKFWSFSFSLNFLSKYDI